MLVFDNMTQIAMVAEAWIAGELLAARDAGVPYVCVTNTVVYIVTVIILLVTKC